MQIQKKERSKKINQERDLLFERLSSVIILFLETKHVSKPAQRDDIELVHYSLLTV